MKTSDTVPILGLYTSDCCGYELIFDASEQFPRCLKCLRLAEWELVEEVFETVSVAA